MNKRISVVNQASNTPVEIQFIDWSARANRYFYQMREFAPLHHELKVADRLLHQHGLPDSISVRSQFIAAYFNALLFTTPDRSRIYPWYQRAKACYDDMLHVEDKIILYNHLMLYNIWTGNMDHARMLYRDFLGIDVTALSNPLIQMMRYTMCAQLEWLNMRVKESIAYVEKGLSFSRQHGASDWNIQLTSQAVYAAISVHDFVQAEQWLQKIESDKRPDRTLDHAQYHYLRAWLDIHVDQPQTAYTHAQRALALTQKAAVPFTIATTEILMAQILYQRHEYPRAAWHILQALRIGRNMQSLHILFAAHLAASWIARDFHLKKQGIKHLRQAFSLGAKNGFYHIPGWPHQIMASLCQIALEEGIEQEYACTLIRMHHIHPADMNHIPATWPWPVELFCFGFLRVRIGGKDVSISLRQKRTVELLKLLLIHPDGVSAHKICDTLWPAVDADIAMQSLYVTQHRLRKLLTCQDALVTEQGRTRLNPLVVMNEMVIVQRLLQQVERAGDETDDDVDATINRLIQIYTGMLLATDKGVPWLVSARGHLHLRCMQVIESHIQTLIAQQAWGQAELLCLKMLEADDLNEAMYYQLLCICQASGSTAKMHRLYTEYSLMLKQRYGIKPARKIQLLMTS